MALTGEIFKQGMAVLSERFSFGRPFGAPLMRVYYNILAPQLSDEEFLAAVHIVIEQEDKFPSGQKLVQAVRPVTTATVNAEEEWAAVMRACRAMPYRLISRETLTAAGWKAVAAVGGLEAICSHMTYETEPFVHRRFISAYVEWATDSAKGERAAVALKALDPRAAALVRGTTKAIGGGNG